MIREYLKKNVLICDGVMGIYYLELIGNDIIYCEFGNINNKDIIKRIYEEYINVGVKLIRINIFLVNRYDLGILFDKFKDIIILGINIVKEVIENIYVFIGVSIGFIREESIDECDSDILDEYKFIVDCFIENNIDIFIFEILSNYNYLKEICCYIKLKNFNSFILI